MVDLRTKFMGLELKSPIIAGSCGLTADIEKLVEIEKSGAGAVILKSVFEEQINNEVSNALESGAYPEAEDYMKNYIRANTLQQYIDLIRLAKSRLTIPVIASINCNSDGEWTSFAHQLEDAGADAIELNMFMLPLDEFKESIDVENMYYKIVKHVKTQIKIPVAVKISHYFTNLSTFVDKLNAYGADSVTTFNRFYEPDIDIDRMVIGVSSVFSTSDDLRATLRWTGILAGKDKKLQISSTTGVHSGEAVVKLLLAGATTVQVCSVLYEEGVTVIRTMNNFLASWMESKSFRNIEQFRGELSYAGISNTARYERAQFMKYFSDKKE